MNADGAVNDNVDKWGPAGPNGEDDDTRERKKREAVTETMQKRLLKKQTREGGSKGGKAATELEGVDDEE